MGNQSTDGVVGWRGVIGRITPAPPSSVWAVDFHSVMPEGIEMKLATVGITARTEEEVDAALSRLDDAANSLANGGVQFIGVEATPLFLVRGLGYDSEIVKRVEKIAKVPATTAFTAAIEALQALKLKRLVMVSPLTPEFGEAAKIFFEDNGFEIVHTKSLNIKDYRDIRVLPRSTAYKAAKEAYLEAPQSDGIFILSGAWCPPFVVDYLERDLGVPVVHGLQVTAWSALRALKIKEPVKGWGRLFEIL